MTKDLKSEDRLLADRLFKEGVALSKSELHLDDAPRRLKPGFWTRIKLNRASNKLKSVIAIVPDHWQSMWILGKICQRLGQISDSFEWFQRALQCNPRNADVPREASLLAMDLGRGEEAMRCCESALELEPNNHGLIANMALASLMVGQLNEARSYIFRSLQIAPNDLASQNVAKIIEHVIKHNAVYPKNSVEMQKYFKQHPELICK